MLMENKINVGQRLRTFRERQGWSLRVLAEQCGLSINAISRIERGENSPTVSSLQRLASALGVPITEFFLEYPKQSAYHIRNGDGKQIHYDCYFIEHLGTDLPGQQLEPFLYAIEPGCNSAMTPISHPGEEFVHCIAGKLDVSVDGQIYSLETGDSLLFEGSKPHFWKNTGSRQAMMLLIFQASVDNSLARQHHKTG
jgi:transcriptional regulator with XRE-family HTH domain